MAYNDFVYDFVACFSNLFTKYKPNRKSARTSRYDAHGMSVQLGVDILWENVEIKEKYKMLSAPRIVEGNFKELPKK